MLSRTAENLFWTARYIERAENTARLVDMGHRMAVLPASEEAHATEWSSVVISAGAGAAFPHLFHKADQTNVAHFLLLDPDNSSSVYNCLKAARQNARAVRTSMTSEVWEAINDAWIAIQTTEPVRIMGGALPDFLDWIKSRGALIRGSIDSSLLRTEAYEFIRLGTLIERADNTSRLLDVKYHVLLPEWSGVGGAVDRYQWISILRAASSLRNYHRAYDGDVTPWGVAEFMILNSLSPRSLKFTYEHIVRHLRRLADHYGQSHGCHQQAESTLRSLRMQTTEMIFQGGLHEFLTDFIAKNNLLSSKVAEAYGFGAVSVSQDARGSEE